MCIFPRLGRSRLTDAWRVLDFSGFTGELRAVPGGIEVLSGDDVSRLPTADVAVVLIGIATTFTSGVIHRLTSQGAAVMFCDWRRVPEAAAYAWSRHTSVGSRQRAQAALSEPRRKNAWQQLVRAKIGGQASNLAYWRLPGYRQLIELRKQVRSGDVENVEGQAARILWRSFGGPLFVRESGTRSGLNGALDYGYMVLRGHVLRETLAAGLNPSLGIFHRARTSAFALVDDLIEPFRPAVDHVVLEMGVEANADDSPARAKLVSTVDRKMFPTGASVATEITKLARNYGRYVEGALDRLPVPTWNVVP